MSGPELVPVGPGRPGADRWSGVDAGATGDAAAEAPGPTSRRSASVADLEALLFVAERPLTRGELRSAGPPRRRGARRAARRPRGAAARAGHPPRQLGRAGHARHGARERPAHRPLPRGRPGAALAGGARDAGHRRLPPAGHARRRRAHPRRRLRSRRARPAASAPHPRAGTRRVARAAHPLRHEHGVHGALRAHLARRPAAARGGDRGPARGGRRPTLRIGDADAAEPDGRSRRAEDG